MTGSGSFSYDDADISGNGTEVINAEQNLTVTFTILGQTFTDVDDLDYTVFGSPDLTFDNGTPVFLDFFLSEIPELPVGTNTIDITEPGVTYIDLWDGFSSTNLTPVVGGFETDVYVNPVPVPAAVWLFGSGLIGLIGIARRKKS